MKRQFLPCFGDLQVKEVCHHCQQYLIGEAHLLYGPRDSFDVEHGVTLNGDTFSEIKGSSVLIMEFLQ